MRDLWFMGARARIHLARADNADGLSVIEHRMEYGFAPPRHVHRDEDETFHVLEGTIRFEAGGAPFDAGPGETVHVPRGTPHGFRVVSPGGGCFLTFTHGGFEDAIRAVSRSAPSGDLPDEPAPTPAMQARLAGLFARHGIDLLAPASI